MNEGIDVAIVGGGPAGLAASLTFGRAKKRAVLFDAGQRQVDARRNARAHAIYNFVTRDGATPDAFRAEARAQLARYETVRLVDSGVDRIEERDGLFVVESAAETVRARRVLLATGMIDEPIAIEGAKELWGHAIFQCPFCHGFEHVGVPWAVLMRDARSVDFALNLTGWTRDLTFLTHGAPLDDVARARLDAARIVVDERRVEGFVGESHTMRAVRFADDAEIACGVLYAHPVQRQVPVVETLGLTKDEHGFVQVDPMRKETSRKGVFAAGDLASGMQSAIFGAAAGTHAAAFIVHELNAHDAVVA